MGSLSRVAIGLGVAWTLLSGCATQSAIMPMDDWITQTLIELDNGVRGQTKFSYSGSPTATANGTPSQAGSGSGSVQLTVTGVFSGKLDVGAPAGFYVMLSGELAGSDTRTVDLKLDPLPGVAQAKPVPGRTATILDCESGGLLDRLFGDGRVHILVTRHVPFSQPDGRGR